MNARLEPRIAATSTHGLSRCGHDPRCAAACTCSRAPARAVESVSGIDTSGTGCGGRLLVPRASGIRPASLLTAVPTLHHDDFGRSEEHTSELQSLMRISYAVFCLKKKNTNTQKSYIR